MSLARVAFRKINYQSWTCIWLAGLIGGFLSWPALGKIENNFSLTPTYYFEDVGQSTSQFASTIHEQLNMSFKPARKLKLHLSPQIYTDPSSPSTVEQFNFDLPEANIEHPFGDVDVKLGINSVAWGVNDVFNPLDVVSARRYFDPLNSEKRGVPSIDLSYDTGAWRTEAIYIPVQLESVLPGDKSRWLPRDITFNRANSFGRLVLANQFNYDIADKVVESDALHNNFGFRVEHHGSGFDWTAIFFQGTPTAPAIFEPQVRGVSISTTTVLANEITLQPVYYLRRTVGVGAVWTLETAIVRFSAANSDRVTSDGDVPGWSQSAVLGVEKNIPIGQSTVTALLQTTYARHEDQADNTVTSLDRIFDQSWMLGLRVSTSSEWSGLLAGLYDSLYQGGYAQAKLERKISDTVSSSLEYDWIDGGAGTPLGTYRRNKRATLGLQVLF